MKALFAEKSIELLFKFPETERFFRRFRVENELKPLVSAKVSDRGFLEWENNGNTIDAFAEFCLLCQPVSEALLPTECVFHAAALRCHEQAYLLAGGSGVGKSTFTKMLTQTYPDEISVINGDKPVLKLNGDGTIMVYPSPWNGKEGWHGAEAAPLGGIILLRRAEKTSIRECSKSEAGISTYQLVFQTFENEDTMRKAATMVESIVKSAPCWILTNGDIEKGFELLARMIREAEDDGI